MTILNSATISANTESLVKYRARYLNLTDDTIIADDGNRRILLSAITSGNTIRIGLGSSKTIQIGLGDGVETTFSYTLNSLLKSSLVIKVNNIQVATDDGAGVITGATIDAGSTVNYITGEIVVVFKVANTPALNDIITAVYNGFDPGKLLYYQQTSGPIDLSEFLEEAKISFGESGKNVYISPVATSSTTIAYVDHRV